MFAELLVEIGNLAGVLVAPLSSNFMGWLKNAAEDGKFDPYEWRMLVQTSIAYAVPAIGVYYGANWLLGVDANAVAAGFTVVLFDQVGKMMFGKKPLATAKHVK